MLISGCATTLDRASYKQSCSLDASKTHLFVSGQTDEKMLSCFEEKFTKDVKDITVNSNGGRVDTAIKISHLIAPVETTLHVVGNCSSSCANYFIPVVNSLVLAPDSKILLHGSIDDGFVSMVKKDATLKGQFDYSWAEELAASQNEFATLYDIDLGWLLFRTDADYENKLSSQFVKGSYETWSKPDTTLKYYLVEKDFILSCLPNLKVKAFQDTVAQNIYTDKRLQAKFTRKGVFPTGNMRCYGAKTEM